MKSPLLPLSGRENLRQSDGGDKEGETKNKPNFTLRSTLSARAAEPGSQRLAAGFGVCRAAFGLSYTSQSPV